MNLSKSKSQSNGADSFYLLDHNCITLYMLVKFNSKHMISNKYEKKYLLFTLIECVHATHKRGHSATIYLNRKSI